MKDIRGFDLLKFLLAVVIVSLHASLGHPFLPSPCSEVIANFQNFAVPTFFVISSYVFFMKIKELPNSKQRAALWHYEKRVLVLYLAWTVIMLPLTLQYHQYFNQSLGLLLFIKDFFFGYTFLASWFFGALIVGVPLVFLLRSNHIVLLSLSLFLYFYLFFIDNLPVFLQLPYQWYSQNVAVPEMSFPKGFIWIGFGCIIAETNALNRFNLPSLALCIGGGILLIISLVVDWLQIVGVISMIVLFYHLKLNNRVADRTFRMRKISTLIYCIHYPIIHVVWRLIPQDMSFWVFIAAAIISIGISEIILNLSLNKKCAFLKYLM